MPNPKKGMNHDEWMSFCMGDSEQNKSFPDKSQRYAVCESKWKQHQKKVTSEWIADSLSIKLKEDNEPTNS